ncbi:NAD-dependent epimerase/dehydratase family protein [Saccharibacillus alkalitolerans]|uniref:NAD-dependent epimerase/dehydratase family protein n=1 Tax=Saccharibacillus alkalitolerans TaxID=2705290 RepID=A0ABX0F6F0_9BACL|nr:NAD-dependent epimerase/dehydratase family protein [Saccharibacillus alkalitolerans]NGZ76536.1 NAD-dependent epimerase/dehydratase family protein [Saccharibacillus alkalitolerans]
MSKLVATTCDGLVKKLADAEKVDWLHPDDLAPWVHAENVAEMCMLAAAHPAAVGQAYNAVDGNYPESQFGLRILRPAHSSGAE